MSKEFSSDQPETVVVSGGGMAGLVFALGTALTEPSTKIVLVDPSPQLGGSFSSFEADNGWLFDRGMHLIPEITAAPFNGFFTTRNGFDDSFWTTLSADNRDRAGKILRGKADSESPLPLLARSADSGGLDSLKEFLSLTGQPVQKCWSAAEYLLENFGPIFLSRYSSYFEELFGQGPEQLHPSVLDLVPLKRVLVEDPIIAGQLAHEQKFSFRIGHKRGSGPENAHANQRPNFYPKTVGMGKFVEKIVTRLKAGGTDFRIKSRISSLQVNRDGAIRGVVIEGPSSEDLVVTNHLIWTAPLTPLAELLAGTNLANAWIPVISRPKRFLRFIHFVTSTALFDHAAYYFYDLDANPVLRITSYSAFSSHPGGFAYTLEVSTSAPSLASDMVSGRQEVVTFLAGLKLSPTVIQQLWADPFVVPLPSPPPGQQFPEIQPPVELSGSLSLFGSAALPAFGLSRDLYSSFMGASRIRR